ncbi:hypothetical protein H0H93_012173 [Arthromyces matolae]|nr:hypothetical protein H0H93_012173 [Arthromyces matolae]
MSKSKKRSRSPDDTYVPKRRRVRDRYAQQTGSNTVPMGKIRVWNANHNGNIGASGSSRSTSLDSTCTSEAPATPRQKVSAPASYESDSEESDSDATPIGLKVQPKSSIVTRSGRSAAASSISSSPSIPQNNLYANGNSPAQTSSPSAPNRRVTPTCPKAMRTTYEPTQPPIESPQQATVVDLKIDDDTASTSSMTSLDDLQLPTNEDDPPDLRPTLTELLEHHKRLLIQREELQTRRMELKTRSEDLAREDQALEEKKRTLLWESIQALEGEVEKDEAEVLSMEIEAQRRESALEQRREEVENVRRMLDARVVPSEQVLRTDD